MTRRNEVDQNAITESVESGAVTPTVTVIPEGETAMSLALRVAFGVFHKDYDQTPARMALVDKAMTFLAPQRAEIEAIAAHGPENLFLCLVEVAVNDAQGAKSIIRQLMRQLTNDAHYRLLRVYADQTRAARAGGGGVEGYELSAAEIMDQYGDYPGSNNDEFGDGTECTPREQVEAVKDIHALLNTAFMTCDAAFMAWKNDYTPQELPFYTHQEGDQFISYYDFDEAASYLDKKADEKVAKRVERSAATVKALAGLSFGKTPATAATTADDVEESEES